MSKTVLTSFALILLSLLWQHTQAAQVLDIYKASVSVESQDSQYRIEAFDKAFQQVLIKASGRFLLVTDTDTFKALLPSESYVQTFSYRENPLYNAYILRQAQTQQELENSSSDLPKHQNKDTLAVTSLDTNSQDVPKLDENIETELAPRPYMLDVSFAPSLVQEKMTELNIPVLSKVRPSTLLWLVFESEGERSILGTSDTSDLTKTITKFSDEFAVPVFLPVADLIDVNSIDIDDIWGLYPETIIDASKRYQPGAIVMMRIIELEDGAWDGSWFLELKELEEFGQSTKESKSEVIKDLFKTLAKSLSEKYSVSPSMANSVGILDVEVGNINSFSDYIGLQEHISNLSPVQSIQVKKVKGSKVFLKLTLLGTTKQFFEHIDLGGKIKRSNEAAFDFEAENAFDNFLTEQLVWISDNSVLIN